MEETNEVKLKDAGFEQEHNSPDWLDYTKHLEDKELPGGGTIKFGMKLQITRSVEDDELYGTITIDDTNGNIYFEDQVNSTTSLDRVFQKMKGYEMWWNESQFHYSNGTLKYTFQPLEWDCDGMDIKLCPSGNRSTKGYDFASIMPLITSIAPFTLEYEVCFGEGYGHYTLKDYRPKLVNFPTIEQAVAEVETQWGYLILDSEYSLLEISSKPENSA